MVWLNWSYLESVFKFMKIVLFAKVRVSAYFEMDAAHPVKLDDRNCCIIINI